MSWLGGGQRGSVIPTPQNLLRWVYAGRLCVATAIYLAGVMKFTVVAPVDLLITSFALVASVGLALAFALKDFASSVAAGLVTILEHTYQSGDWIEVDGAYGEVKKVGLRAVHIVTPDDTEVIIPHSCLWTSSIHNATSGNRSLLCVADFYLNPDHDASAARPNVIDWSRAEAQAGRQILYEVW